MNYERPGTLIWRLFYPILIFIGVEFVVEFITLMFYLVPGINGGTFANMDNEEIIEQATQFIYNCNNYIAIARATVLAPLLAFFIKHDDKYDVRLNRDVKYEGYNKWFLLLLIPAGIGASIGFNGLVSLSGIAEHSKVYKEIESMQFSGSLLVQLLAAAVAAPIVEELLFRGLIYRRLRYHLKPSMCILVSATIFGLIHGNIVQFVYAFLVGTLLAYAYEKFKTVWAPIIMHASANFIAVIITGYLPNYEKEISIGDVMLISVVSLAVTFAALKLVDLKVNRNEIKASN